MDTKQGNGSGANTGAGKVIVEAMCRRGLNYHDVAEAAGMKPEALGAALMGRRSLMADEFVRVCAALGLSLKDFQDAGGPKASAKRLAWTTHELRYLEEHAHEGADAVAKALGRSPEAVKHQAKANGVSLRIRWQCPNCGQITYRPLNPKTGWCSVCTKAARRNVLEEETRAMEEETRRDLDENRKRQALYAKRCRIRKAREARREAMPDAETPEPKAGGGEGARTSGLAARREELGLAPRNAAEALGLSAEALEEYERDPLKAPANVLVTASRLYGCSVAQLMQPAGAEAEPHGVA